MNVKPSERPDLTQIPWKSTVVAPPDAKRPMCKTIMSRNGVDGLVIEDLTDEQDWLCVIAYERTQ